MTKELGRKNLKTKKLSNFNYISLPKQFKYKSNQKKIAKTTGSKKCLNR